MILRDGRLDDLAGMARTEATAAYNPWTEKALRETADQPASFSLVCDHNELGCVGHLIARSVAGEGELLTIAVRPDLQRQGIATKLLAAAKSRWEKEGVEEAFLEVRESNHGARALYAKHGWLPLNTRPDYYGPGVHALVLRWRPH